jgi:hypothetical protein
MRDGATVTSKRILGLFGRELNNLALVDFFCFLDA